MSDLKKCELPIQKVNNSLIDSSKKKEEEEKKTELKKGSTKKYIDSLFSKKFIEDYFCNI